MWKSWIKGLVGLAAFFLPVLMCFVGLDLDQSRFAYDVRYGVLIPVVMFGSVVLAAVVPAAFILSSKLSLTMRLGLTAAILCLLVAECGLTLHMVLIGSLR